MFSFAKGLESTYQGGCTALVWRFCMSLLRQKSKTVWGNPCWSKLDGKLRPCRYREGFILHYVWRVLHHGKTDFLGEAACARAPDHVFAQWVLEWDVLHGNSALFSHSQLAVFVKVQYLTWQVFIYIQRVWKLIKLLSKGFGSTAAAWLVSNSWPYRKTEHPRDPSCTAALMYLDSKTLL